MSVTDRIFRIHTLIREGRGISNTRLMDELEVSRATIKRDIALLRDQLGAPLIYESSRRGYIYDPSAPEFEIPGLWFNPTELYALLAMEQLLEELQPGLLGPHIGPLKGRIRRLLEQGGHQSNTVSARIHLQPNAHRQFDNRHFGNVAGAVLNARQLDMTYRGRARDETTQRRVHPYRLQHYRDNWYLIAHCERAQDLRVFSVDRIIKVCTTSKRVRKPDVQQLNNFLKSSFGIFSGEAKGWAVLLFTPQRAQWVADEQWHPEQKSRWVDGSYELQVPYSDATELIMDILKYGPDVEVIAPSTLRTQVAHRLRSAIGHYRDIS